MPTKKKSTKKAAPKKTTSRNKKVVSKVNTLISKSGQDKISPQVVSIIDGFNKVLLAHGITEYQLHDFTLKSSALTLPLNCPCGTEGIFRNGRRIGTRCKRCPPSA